MNKLMSNFLKLISRYGIDEITEFDDFSNSICEIEDELISFDKLIYGRSIKVVQELLGQFTSDEIIQLTTEPNVLIPISRLKRNKINRCICVLTEKSTNKIVMIHHKKFESLDNYYIPSNCNLTMYSVSDYINSSILNKLLSKAVKDTKRKPDFLSEYILIEFDKALDEIKFFIRPTNSPDCIYADLVYNYEQLEQRVNWTTNNETFIYVLA